MPGASLMKRHILSLMIVSRVHHAQITIPPGAEDEARRFYGGLLGMSEIAKPEALRGRGGLWFEVSGFQLHLGIEDDRAPTRAHLAWEVDDLDAVRKMVVEAGLHIYESVPIPGIERFESKDPFDNRIEFMRSLR